MKNTPGPILAILKEKKEVAPDVLWLRFQVKEPKELLFDAGQYLVLAAGEKHRRPYSIASSDNQKGFFELVMRLVPNGIASEYLRNARHGQECTFLGPYGLFTMNKNSNRDKIFFATGTGIAPIRSQILSFLETSPHKDTTQLSLFWGLRDKKSSYFQDEFSSLAGDHPNFSFSICLDGEQDPTALNYPCFFQGRIQERWRSHLQSTQEGQSGANNFEYYICGSPTVVTILRGFLQEHEVQKDHIFFERF